MAESRHERRSRRWAVTLLVLGVLATGCRADREASVTPMRPLAAVLEAHTPELMEIPGVVGTGESRLDDGRPCILLLVSHMTPELQTRLPQDVEGWPVRVQEVGEVRAYPDSSR